MWPQEKFKLPAKSRGFHFITRKYAIESSVELRLKSKTPLSADSHKIRFNRYQ